MTITTATPMRPMAIRARGLLAAVTAALLAGACSGDLGLLGGEPMALASNTETSQPAKPEQSKSELNKAVEYWAKEHKSKPTDLKAGLAYARNLKAAGNKDEAFGVMQSLALVHGGNTELASEYGRLALDLGQVQVANQLLTMANDPVKPDWRVISALGTVQAKQGKFADAIPFYERALSMAPDQPSVLNNLAMAHAANGEPAKAEEILRRIAAKGGDARIQQNLAIVLGLQNKHGDAQKVAASADLPPGAADANTDYVRQMVKTPVPAETMAPLPAVAPAPAAAPDKVASAKRAKGSGSTAIAAAPKSPKLRESAGPSAADAPTSGWDTTVARAQ